MSTEQFYSQDNNTEITVEQILKKISGSWGSKKNLEW